MMSAISSSRSALFAAVVTSLVLASGAMADGREKDQNPGIAPIKSSPAGKSYSEWAAKWWQWALEMPATGHPLIDGRCDVGQPAQRHVWFLGGSFGSGEAVVRTCTVPTGTNLFFPLINAFYGAFLSDPPDTRTEQFLRAQVACTPAQLAASIDQIPIKNPAQYFEKSPLFEVQLPEEDNLFGAGPDVIPELRLSPSVDQGYYLFLRPLPPGQHTLWWTAEWSCPFGDFKETITYNLTVVPRGKSPHHHMPRRTDRWED